MLDLTCQTEAALQAFHQAACEVPAYRTLLAEKGLDPGEIRTHDDFVGKVPLLDKHNTFQRFPVRELCRNGQTGRIASVLTSSGHSGVFAFGLYDTVGGKAAVDRIDEALDLLFDVKTRPTLLINCLPMGVKVYTQACTLGETSVRPDMACGLVEGFASEFAQIILVGETAFIKHLLELGARRGIDWPSLQVSIIVGEEPIAENARAYLQELCGIDPERPETGLVGSTMGVGELGLNLLFEAPPPAVIPLLRRTLHRDTALRDAVFGPGRTHVPMIFTFDPRRIHLEFLEDGSLVVTTLDVTRRIPLIRYRTGDVGRFVTLPDSVLEALAGSPLPVEVLNALPLVAIEGRGNSVDAGGAKVTPEQVKEGIYAEADLARQTTANFRLSARNERAMVRLQLERGFQPDKTLEERYAQAISRYVQAPVDVRCGAYETFTSGMSLDYERKFDYLGDD